MQNYECELLIYRISSRYLKFDNLEIRYPTLNTLYEAQEIYNETVKSSEGVMCDDDILLEMLNRDLITQYEDNQLEDVLPKHLEQWKMDLYENFNNEEERARIKKYISVVKNELNSLFIKKHAYDHLTIHGVATFSKWYYIIENSTFKNNEKYDFGDKKIASVLEFYNRNVVTEEMIRQIARTEPWRSIWSAGKKNGQIFPYTAVELTDDQRRLINWSGLYDNIQEYDDCPSEEIIDCDDALDGWLLKKKKERDSKKNESSYKNKIEKFKPNAEVFIPTSNKQEARKIYDLNNQQNRNIINNRLDLINKSKGDVRDLDFADVKLQARIAQNQAYIQSMKDRK